MHIIFVTSEMPTKENYRGGLATFTVNIAEIFAAKGNQVEILHVTTKEEQEEYACTVKVKNIYFLQIRTNNRRKKYQILYILPKEKRKKMFDI